jgi:pimeloyl-ACP methyl ester carboxylesterase
MKHLYFFSGLGVDERMFAKLDLSGLDHTFIQWIGPRENETIESYAKRISSQITETEPVLIGLSFGGMMAIEVSKILPVRKTIIISSIKHRKEIPVWHMLAGKLLLHHLVPTAFLKSPGPFKNWLFGASTKEEKQLMAAVLKDTDPEFLEWAIDKILNWKNQTIPPGLLHIHGTKDKLLPARRLKDYNKIEGGEHLMVYSRPEEIISLIRKHL